MLNNVLLALFCTGSVDDEVAIISGQIIIGDPFERIPERFSR